MEYIAWNDEYSVGIEIFDKEHKYLVTTINALNDAMLLKETRKKMGIILTRLVKYTQIHFAHEEDFMVIYDYPGYKQHKEEHQALTGEVAEFLERFKEGKANFSLELMNFLRDWLINHIQGSDKKYSKFFLSKGIK